MSFNASSLGRHPTHNLFEQRRQLFVCSDSLMDSLANLCYHRSVAYLPFTGIILPNDLLNSAKFTLQPSRCACLAALAHFDTVQIPYAPSTISFVHHFHW